MKKPCIYFYGDEKACLSFMKGLNAPVRTVFLSPENSRRFPKKPPAVICIIARRNGYTNSEKLTNLLEIAKAYRCGVLFIGSKYQFSVLKSKHPELSLTKTTAIKLHSIIKDTINFMIEHKFNEFDVLKSHFKIVNFISKEAAFAAHIDKTINTTNGECRMVLTGDIPENEYDYTEAFILSENKNREFEKSDISVLKEKESDSSSILTVGMGEKPYSKQKPQYLDMRSDNGKLIKIVTRRCNKKFIK